MTGTVAERLQERMPTRLAGVPLWAKAVVVYLALRLVTGFLMAGAADGAGYYPGVQGPSEGHIDLALNWDAVWYERIFDHGYPDQLPVGPDGRVLQNEWAFYPVYPYAVRFVAWLTSSDFATVAPWLALLAGVGAAVVMTRLLVETLPASLPTARLEVLALATVAVWAACPVAPVLQMAYTESFSMLLLVTFLLLLVRERWWLAGVCAVAIGLTRPIALPLVVVVLAGLWLRWRARTERPIEATEWVGMTAALGLTGLSGILWTTIAALGTGERDAYPETMTAWRGDDHIAFLEPWKRTISYAWETHEIGHVLASIGILVPLALSLLMLLPQVARGLDLRLRVWSAAYSLYLLAVVNGHSSIFRYLVALFPLAALFVGAHRDPPRWWQVRTALWIAVGIGLQVAWIWILVVFSPMPGGGDLPP